MKITNIKRSELQKGIVVSTVNIFGEYFETMVFSAEGDELDCFRATTKKEAIMIHNEAVKNHSPKWDQLQRFVSEADQLSDLYDDMEDGGSCNFDTAIINLKGCPRTIIESLPVEKKKGTWYFLRINHKGMALRRTKKAEVIANYLTAEGFDCSVHYVLD